MARSTQLPNDASLPAAANWGPLLPVLGLLAALAFFGLSSCFYTVGPESVGVVQRFGRYVGAVGPGLRFKLPFGIDQVTTVQVTRQLKQEFGFGSEGNTNPYQWSSPSEFGFERNMVTGDLNSVLVDWVVQYRITEPEKTVYRIRDVDGAIATTVAGIVRSEIGKLELDQVQSNRSDLIVKVREQVATMVEDWGIEVTRAEILDVSLDDATRAAMLQQLNAERARRAQVTEAEGKKRAVELNADAELYAAEQEAKARRVLADAEAYATGVIAEAIKESGIEAAQYQVALKQVEALTAVGQGAGKQMIIVPAQALDAFGDAFKMLKGRV
jgi:regulator of protease activity HflC (stomatin/prohibitin superfamily)